MFQEHLKYRNTYDISPKKVNNVKKYYLSVRITINP